LEVKIETDNNDAVEIKTEADSNDVTDCYPSTGMFIVSVAVFYQIHLIICI